MKSTKSARLKIEIHGIHRNPRIPNLRHTLGLYIGLTGCIEYFTKFTVRPSDKQSKQSEYMPMCAPYEFYNHYTVVRMLNRYAKSSANCSCIMVKICLPECLPDEATPVTGWFDLRSLLDYGPKTNSSLSHIFCRCFLNAFTDVAHTTSLSSLFHQFMTRSEKK